MRWMWIAGLVTLTGAPALAEEEILVVLPTRAVEVDEGQKVATTMRKTVIEIAPDLEMDALTDKETQRALRRWADDKACKKSKCDLKKGQAVGAEILVVSELKEKKGKLTLSLELYDMRGNPKKLKKKKKRKKKKKGGKPYKLQSRKVTADDINGILKVAGDEVDALLAAEYFEEEDEEEAPANKGADDGKGEKAEEKDAKDDGGGAGDEPPKEKKGRGKKGNRGKKKSD